MQYQNSALPVFFGTLEVMVQSKERSYIKSPQSLVLSLPGTATIKSNKWLFILTSDWLLGITTQPYFFWKPARWLSHFTPLKVPGQNLSLEVLPPSQALCSCIF